MNAPAAALVLCSAAAAAAAPAPPDGWTSSPNRDHTLYTPKGRSDVELRVDVSPTKQTVEAWFAQRARTPAGAGISAYGAPQAQGPLQLAMAPGTRNGAAVVAIALGCKAADGTASYGVLIAPQDTALLEDVARAAILVVALSCGLGPQKPTAAPAAPATKSAPAAPATKAARPAFPYVTTPGNGLPDAQIEAVIYSWEQRYTVGGLQMYEDLYLVLRDGTVRRDVPPVAPTEFDYKAERTAAPKKWGVWTRKGSDYAFKFEGQREYHVPRGALRRAPGKRGERLANTYEAWSSYAIGQVSSVSRRSITFAADGTFQTTSFNSTGGTTGDVTSISVATDDGAAGAVTTPSGGGGSSRTRPSTLDDRSGTYAIDGYTLELRFASGRTERMFFVTRDDRRTVWLHGAEYAVRSSKK